MHLIIRDVTRTKVTTLRTPHAPLATTAALTTAVVAPPANATPVVRDSADDLRNDHRGRRGHVETRRSDRQPHRLRAMRLTGSAAFHLGTPSDRERSITVLHKAIDLGVNHIDTAAFYFSQLRSANELINSALAPYPDDLLIATKVGPYRDYHGEWGTSARPDQLRGHVEENLRQLGRDHLDLVYLRRMRQDSVAEHFGALAELREAGLIRHLGLSDVEPQHLAEAQAIAPVVAVENRYGLDSHNPATDELLRLCGEQGIAFVPFYAVAGQRGRRPRPSPTAKRCSPSPAPTTRAPPRSGSPGRCTRARTSSPSPAPATPTTSPRTWPPARSVSRTTS